ncbi:MAG: hypothetical protein WDO68_16630 [Gammaproteobacteria bacterium]
MRAPTGDDFNLYAYVENDPFNNTDPTGKCPWCLIGAAISGGIQLAVEVSDAGDIGNIDASGWQRIGISAATGLIGGGAATAIGRLAVMSTRIVAGVASGAVISAGQQAASTALQENRTPTAGELVQSAGTGAAASLIGGVVAEKLATTGPTVVQVARDAPAAAKSLAASVNSATRSSYTQHELDAAQATRTAGQVAGTFVDGIGNSQKPQNSIERPPCAYSPGSGLRCP